MNWIPLAPQLCAAGAMVIAPGLLIALVLRMRWSTALLAAPALTVGLTVVASTLLPFVGIQWTYAALAGCGVLLAAALFFSLRRALDAAPRARNGSSEPQLLEATQPGALQHKAVPGRRTLWTALSWAAAVAGICLIAWRCMTVFGEPSHISQSYDNVYHLNVLRYIEDTGQASSLTVGHMTDQPYYPAGWHALVSAVGFALGLDIPVAVNVVNVVIAAIVWPFSCLLLARSVYGHRPVPTVAAAVAASGLGAFPLLMLDFGVLYPNLLAISTLPASVALTALFFQWTRASAGKAPVLAAAGAAALSVAGTAGSHPTTFMAWVVFAASMWVPSLWNRLAALLRRRRDGLGRLAKPAVLLAAETALVAGLVLGLWLKVRPPKEAAFWGPYMTPPQAFGEMLLLAPIGLPAAWVLGALAVFGLWGIFRRKLPVWPVLAYAAFAILYTVIAGYPGGRLRDFLTGVWYNDSYRVAALLPTAALLLVVAGADFVVDTTSRIWKRARPNFLSGSSHILPVLAAAVVIIVFFGASQRGNIQQASANAARMYQLTENSALISPDELALLERLDDDTPPDAVVIGNPYTGTALSYAFADRRNVQLHVIAYVPPALENIYNNLNNISSDPSVCDSVRELDARYVLDFGDREVHGGNHSGPGLENLANNPGLSLVDSQGSARLYKITACG